jgi:DNA-binding transcriptional ArsR family regulator
MSKIFPIRTERDFDLDEPVVVDLGSDKAEVYLDALSSKTTREIFVELHETPSTMSDLSNMFDDSIQNIKYHVEKLEESNLVDTVGTDYSERGNEMDVYAPTNEALVLLAGTEEAKSSMREKLKPLSVFVALAGIVSVIFSMISEIKTTLPQKSYSSSGDDVQITQSPENGLSPTSVENTTSGSEPEIIEEFTIGFISMPSEIAILAISLMSILIGALIYHILRKKF